MKSYIKNIVVLVVTIIIAVIASMDFLSMHKNEEIAQNPSITEIKMLSQYSPRLKGTSLDTEVYFFDSGIEGGTFLILGDNLRIRQSIQNCFQGYAGIFEFYIH